MLQPYWQYPCWQGAARRQQARALRLTRVPRQVHPSQVHPRQAHPRQMPPKVQAQRALPSPLAFHGRSERRGIGYLVNKFNSENTMGIQVEAQYQGEYDDTINKLKSAQIGNMGADLVQIYDIGTRFMIDSGWVVPMQELIDADRWDKTQIEPNIAAYYTVGDTLYSMPFNSSTPLLYYNKGYV